MMFNKSNNQSDIKATLAPILRVLSQLGGKFSFTDDEGRQFVIMRQEDLQAQEKQMSFADLPEKSNSADDVLERINREIAFWQMQDDEDTSEPDEDVSQFSEDETFHRSQEGVPTPPDVNKEEKEEAKRVRFEPLKGDLDPELQ